jgi:CubicO group peptidase (beta-lactamase class C family)
MTDQSTATTGTVAAGWEPVAEAFAENFRAGREVGAGVAIYHRGRLVVDLTGGSFAPGSSDPYDEQTLQLVFSTTKGVTAVAVAMCVHRGLLDYDEKVTRYWPEFAAEGKDDVTVAQLLSHQVGLVSVDPPTSLDDALDWDTITGKLAAQRPLWTPGTAHGYHALTYGWLAGELVRRVDPRHRSLGTFVAEEIVGPLGVEFWIGLPDSEEHRVSPVIPSPPPEDPAVREMIAQVMGPGTMAWRALTLDGAIGGDSESTIFNERRFHAAEVPAANGIGNARSLARIYAATIDTLDGVELFSTAVRDRARATVTPEGEPDACLVFPTTFGMGFMTAGMISPYMGAGCYGHPGAGGSVAFASPEAELAFAYVMNRMDNNLTNDPRTQTMIDAAKSVIGA